MRNKGSVLSAGLTDCDFGSSIFGIRIRVRYAKHHGQLWIINELGVKIGSQVHRSTAISTSNETTILVRGRDLTQDLIGRIGFTEHFWLLLTGTLPTAAQTRILDATLVAIAEHGLVPSAQVARMT